MRGHEVAQRGFLAYQQQAGEGRHALAVGCAGGEAEGAVHRLVVEFEILRNDFDPGVRFDCVHTVVYHREVAKSQEVHLQQAECLANTHIELSDDRAVLLTLPDRNDVNQRLTAQDDASGVHSRLALEALKAFGRVDNFRNVCVGII